MFRPGATVIVLGIILAAALLWPIPALGLDVDPSTGTVIALSPQSAAHRGGVQVGDQLLALYGADWPVASTRLMLLPLPWHDGTPSPLTIQRGATTLTLNIVADPPDGWQQFEKLLSILLGLTCWAVGVGLGTAPRATDPNLRRVAWFWVLLGGTIGMMRFAQTTSYPLELLLLWVQATILAPLAVGIHLWYPLRPIAVAQRRRAVQLLVGILAAFQLGGMALALTSGSLTTLTQHLSTITPFLFIASFVISGMILGRVYRATTSAHLHRQIRLIGLACALCASWWALYFFGSISLSGLIPAIPISLVVFSTIVIPLAYLVGGVTSDLFRVDRLLRHILVVAITALLIVITAASFALMSAITLTPVVLVVVGVATFPSAYGLSRSILRVQQRDEHTHLALGRTTALLGTTLAPDALIAIVSEGLRAVFHNPPLAFYHRSNLEQPSLQLVRADALTNLPPIYPRELEPVLPSGQHLLSSTEMQQALEAMELDLSRYEPGLAGLVAHASIALIGVIRHSHGEVLALIFLGPRGDLDPYRPHDRREIERLLTEAGLAFTNSAHFAEQRQSQELIRQLYRRMQLTQEETAAAIAREIHDEVLNVNLRLNIETLQRLQAQLRDPAIHDDLGVVLDGEQATMQALRMICEKLQPSGYDDPLGLVANLRQVISRVGAKWSGCIRLQVAHDPVPLARPMHHELYRIAREAITNAVKHANATEIVVTLGFPQPPDDTLTLIVQDNGLAVSEVMSRPGHWGLHYMRESANAIGAEIQWSSVAGGGTAVVVTVAVADPARAAAPLLTT